MPIDAKATIAAMEKMKAAMDVEVRFISKNIAATIQKNARATTPMGREGNSTNPPGELAASIIIDGPHFLNRHTTFTQVGPTTIYGRQRELGGPLVPKRAAYMRFVIDTQVFYKTFVNQKDNPYLYRGLMASEGEIGTIVNKGVAKILLLP